MLFDAITRIFFTGSEILKICVYFKNVEKINIPNFTLKDYYISRYFEYFPCRITRFPIIKILQSYFNNMNQ